MFGLLVNEKSVKKIFLGAAILISCYAAAPKDVKAEHHPIQGDHTEEYHMVYYDNIVQHLSPGFWGTVGKISIWGKNQDPGFGGSPGLRMTILDLTNSALNSDMQELPAGDCEDCFTENSEEQSFLIKRDGIYDPYTFIEGHDYALLFSGNGGFFYFNGILADREYDCNIGAFTDNCDPVEEMYTNFEIGPTLDPTVIDFIGIREGTVTRDFENWQIRTEGSFNNFYAGDVTFGATNAEQFTNPIAPHLLCDGCVITLPKVPTSTPGDYLAKARLYRYNFSASAFQIIYETPIMHFTIVPGEIIYVPDDTSTETPPVASCQATDFTIFDIDFGNAVCRLSRFLFYPTDASTDRWMTLYEDTKTKMPFTLFYDFKDSLAGASTSTASSTLFTYTATNTAISGININLKSATTELIGTTNFNLLYTFMTYGVWFLVGAYGFYRVKNLI